MLDEKASLIGNLEEMVTHGDSQRQCKLGIFRFKQTKGNREEVRPFRTMMAEVVCLLRYKKGN